LHVLDQQNCCHHRQLSLGISPAGRLDVGQSFGRFLRVFSIAIPARTRVRSSIERARCLFRYPFNISIALMLRAAALVKIWLPPKTPPAACARLAPHARNPKARKKDKL
jgi:hypothetical protein